MNLLSSAGKKGRFVTQIIKGIHGQKVTYRGVDTETIEQGEFTKFELKDGRFIFVNTSNVFTIEVFKE